MRKASLFVVLSAALVFAAAGSAITNGVPDGNAHPEVGALLATQAFSDGTWEECTGTLISAHVFLTAEHCDLGVSRVEVTFASTSFTRGGATPTGARGTAIPSYNQSRERPARPRGRRARRQRAARGHHSGAPARRPTRSRTCPSDQQFTPVGYGAQSVTSGPGGKTFHYQDVRYRTVGTLNTVTPGLAEDLRELVARRRQHLLRRLRRPELPRRRRLGDEHHRRRRRSPATRPAARRTSTTASTRRRRGRSSGSTSRFRKALGGRALRKRGPAAHAPS